MEFALNIIYGGELNASKALSPFVRNMRKIIKDTFASFENDGVFFFKLTLLFDGDISSYYNGTGVYQPRYYSAKKEYRVSFCIDRTQCTGSSPINSGAFILVASESSNSLRSFSVISILRYFSQKYPSFLRDATHIGNIISNCFPAGAIFFPIRKAFIASSAELTFSTFILSVLMSPIASPNSIVAIPLRR